MKHKSIVVSSGCCYSYQFTVFHKHTHKHDVEWCALRNDCSVLFCVPHIMSAFDDDVFVINNVWSFWYLKSSKLLLSNPNGCPYSLVCLFIFISFVPTRIEFDFHLFGHRCSSKLWCVHIWCASDKLSKTIWQLMRSLFGFLFFFGPS